MCLLYSILCRHGICPMLYTPGLYINTLYQRVWRLIAHGTENYQPLADVRG
jgi:hypothetical protein